MVISNPPPFKAARFGRQPGGQIRTQKFSGRNDRGQKSFGGPTIPIIDFFNRAPEGAPDPIIDEGKATGTRVTERGVEGHRDFPDEVQPFDIVLYHELRHAMLEQTGVSHALHQHAPPDQTDRIEEQLVVGLEGGRGLAGSENDYRAERGGVPLRGSYRAVDIENDPQVDQTRWPSQGGPIVTIDQALELAGLGPRFTEKVVPDDSK